MRVMLTGADGYIGSICAPYLLERGLDVVALDTGYYRAGWLYPMGGTRPPVVTRDLRHLTRADFEGFDAVVHMAELSNDPIGQQDPALTFEINHAGSVRIARLAKEAGVERFVYMSSCSVYGANPADAEFVDEESPTNPLTAYAECKLRVEADVAPMADDTFAPCFLRNATAYGASPRQRFDIVLNEFAGLAWTTREIRLNSDGSAWRPLVHVLDISQAIHHALMAPADRVSGQIFNVGSSDQNYRAIEIARAVESEFPGCRLDVGARSVDNRSYKVSFDKIGTLLPGFSCEWDAPRGAAQMHEVFRCIAMTEDEFRSPPYTRLKMLDKLRASGLLDSRLFWTFAG